MKNLAIYVSGIAGVMAILLLIMYIMPQEPPPPSTKCKQLTAVINLDIERLKLITGKNQRQYILRSIRQQRKHVEFECE